MTDCHTGWIHHNCYVASDSANLARVCGEKTLDLIVRGNPDWAVPRPLTSHGSHPERVRNCLCMVACTSNLGDLLHRPNMAIID